MLFIDSKKYPKPRSRHHNASNVYFPLHALGAIPKFYPPLIDTIDWSNYYKNSLPPTILDLGCGWGSCILQLAHDNSEDNILGLEVRKLPVDWINEVIIGESLTNLSAIWYSLPNGLSFLQDESISTFFSFFPDPWIKKKHHKRRAFTADLIKECLRISKRNAQFWQMTDVPMVAKHHIEILSEFKEITIDSFEFVGEWNDEWSEEFPDSLPYQQDMYQRVPWTIPKTDQEEFSLKKGIPYLKTHFTINK
jgi:tRNA (guanine-N(7)-)-methyltransferase